MRELLNELKAAGHNVVNLYGGLVLTGAGVSVTIGHEEEGFTTYIQTDTAAGPEYSGDTALTKAAVLQLCQTFNTSIAA
jgi:hypothetical protein